MLVIKELKEHGNKTKEERAEIFKNEWKELKAAKRVAKTEKENKIADKAIAEFL